MKAKYQILTLGIAGAITYIGATNASGLTYQSSVTNSFEIQPSVSIKLSDSKLIIDDLTPGNSADSNFITITAETNNNAGYTLYSTVGNSTYDTTDLIQSGMDDKFSILTGTDSLSEGKWGYSYSNNYDDTEKKWTGWSNYAGLIKYDDTESTPVNLIDVDSAATTTIAFKIGAQATSTQAFGEYNNMINFIALVKDFAESGPACNPSGTTINDIICMQDIANGNKTSVYDSMTVATTRNASTAQYQLYDSRDGKQYYVARLADGHIWMTQNLDLNLDKTKTLKHADTDLGWGTDAATTEWTPANSTIGASGGITISNWTNNNNTPYSIDVGDWYWIGKTFYSSDSSGACNYLTGCTTKFTQSASNATNNSHGHVGNYYNWSAAVAMNNTSSYSSSTLSNIANSPQNSICPAGWRLPTVSDASRNESGSTNEFSRLNYLYNSGSTSNSQNLETSPLFFVRGGEVSGTLSYAGYQGYYWSSTVYSSSSSAYYLTFRSDYVGPVAYSPRSYGYSVRCVAR